MAAPSLQQFHEFVVEIETNTPGTYAKICGITGRSVNRNVSIEEITVPRDCSDESLGVETKLSPGPLVVTINGTAKWAQQSHGTMMDWIYSKATKNVRVQHVNAAVGDTEYESGPAYCVQLNDNAEIEGTNKYTVREIEIRFNGEPTRTAKSA